MKKYLYYLPHIVTLAGLGFAVAALTATFSYRFDAAARWSLLVLAVDRVDGTMARRLEVSRHLPGISGQILDIITDLVGLTLVPMMLFCQTGLFVPGSGLWLATGAVVSASWKYSRKESFLSQGYSVGAPPIYFSLFLFYFLQLPPIYPTLYAAALIALTLSPIRYPITSLVTTHWKPGYKSVTNYLTAIFFIPVIVYLQAAPNFIYWLMLIAILTQLTIYPVLLYLRIIKPVFNRTW